MSTDDRLPRILYPSRKQMFLLLMVSSGFVAGGIWMARTGERTGYFCAAFFGVCALVFLTTLHPRAAYLRLEPDGFTFCSLFRKHTVPWTDVEGFTPVRVGFNRLVGWNYRPGRCRYVRMASVSKGLTGCEAALPDNYGMKPEALAQLLNQLLELHKTAEAV